MRKKRDMPILVSEPYSKVSWTVLEAFTVLVLSLLLATLPTALLDTSRLLPHYLSLLLQAACFSFLPYLIVKRRGGGFAELGLRAMFLPKMFIIGILWGVGLYLLNVFVATLQGFFFPASLQQEQAILSLLQQSSGSGEVIILVVFILVVSPFSEELLFRGFLFPAFKQHFRPLGAILASSFIFAAIHFNLWVFLPLFAGGAGFALLYQRHNNLFCNVIAHSTWNVISLLMFFDLS